MSRLMVKNIPKTIKEQRLRGIFEQHGEVTQVKIFPKRRFAYIGYFDEKGAQKALRYLDKSYIDTSRIEVAVALAHGDKALPRPWSKYSTGSSANEAKQNEANKEISDSSAFNDRKQKLQKHALDQVNKTIEKEKAKLSGKPKNASFQKVEGKMYGAKGVPMVRTHVTFESDNDDSDDDKTSEKKVAQNDALSDMEYLRSKMKSDHEGDEAMSDSEADTKNVKGEKTETSTESIAQREGRNVEEDVTTVRLRGLPFSATAKDITDFFHPLTPLEIRMTRDRKDRPSGRAFVDFPTGLHEKALAYNQDHIGDRYIEVTLDTDERSDVKQFDVIKKPPLKFPAVDAAGHAELAESGRIFVRNLAYACTEAHLKDLFIKFGPISEVFIPIHPETKQSKAFGFITYLMPEHAVAAYEALDGKPFQGRLLHLLPAKERRDTGLDTNESDDRDNYKKKREAKRRAQSGSSFNWNTLFMRADTVADSMANSFGVSKSMILDPTSEESMAVRMAMGETHIVAENKKFLAEHGISLSSFDTRIAKRSDTVLLVKNTHFDVTEDELREMFGVYGSIGRVIIPPSRTMALIEMIEPSEARKAFTHLAYKKHKNVPLYLEWAPHGVFDVNAAPLTNSDVKKEIIKSEDDEDDDDDDDESNDLTTVFVKNLNFDTTEESLKALFERNSPIRSVKIAKKSDTKRKGHLLSMGFAFVEFSTKEQAMKVIKELQGTELDGHKLSLKLSDKKKSSVNNEKQGKAIKVGGSKLLIRNLAFETSKKEIKELCAAFGQVKSVRLPKKFDGSHRGFAFVEFLSKKEAREAFEALSGSTHLYGRRLVVEWAEGDKSIEHLQSKTKRAFTDGPRLRGNKRARKSLENEIVEG
eukprot:m.212073 g.212073  ORF g.212073 m.212073 type:complete len:869 (+) comp15847_c0_seq1:210-2816(+)